MYWHIITGCKGGIGKTLLTLALLGYHLEQKLNEGILVLDLNGMNTDSAAILLHEKRVGNPLDIPVLNRQGKHLTFQKTYSLDGTQSHNYVVGWPRYPFELQNRVSFVELLKTISVHAEEIIRRLNQEPMGPISPLKHVIIDTNYHFCNIFGWDDAHYTAYTEKFLQQNKLQIWFLWIYRQLDKLIKDPRSRESQWIMQTAARIEQHMKSSDCPMMHVFTPVAMEPPREGEEGVLTILAKRFYQALTKNEDYIIQELKTLEKKEASGCISFQKLVETFSQAHIAVGGRDSNDPHLLFIDTLVKLFNLIDSENASRPRNIIPLSNYEYSLKYYTDKKRKDAVAKLREFETYKSFVRLYEVDK